MERVATEWKQEARRDLSAVVRSGCFRTEEDALDEAVRTLFNVRPELRVEAAIRRYLDDAVSLGRAAELAGVSRWTFEDLLAQRGHKRVIEVRPAAELEQAVERIRKLRA